MAALAELPAAFAVVHPPVTRLTHDLRADAPAAKRARGQHRRVLVGHLDDEGTLSPRCHVQHAGNRAPAAGDLGVVGVDLELRGVDDAGRDGVEGDVVGHQFAALHVLAPAE